MTERIYIAYRHVRKALNQQNLGPVYDITTRRALGRVYVPPTKLFPRLAVNKTILKPRVAAATGAQYLCVGFSRRNKNPRCSAHDIGESNPVPAYGL